MKKVVKITINKEVSAIKKLLLKKKKDLIPKLCEVKSNPSWIKR